MQIKLTTPFQIDWKNPISGLTEKRTITKLEVSYAHLDYRKNSVVLSVIYKDDNDFCLSTNHSDFGSKAVDPVITGADFTTVDTVGANQSEIYSLLQSKYGFLAGTVS